MLTTMAIVLTSGAFAAGLATAPDGAQAYPRLDRASCANTHARRVLNYHFAGTGWTASERSQVTAGFQSWDNKFDRYGNQFFDSDENTGAGSIPVFDGGLSGGSTFRCPGGSPEIVIGGNNYTRSATHESGHAHGLHHSGTYDSLYGLPPGPNGLPSQHQPIMDGCKASDGVIRNDDMAQAFHEWDGSHVAGVGFENGLANHLGSNWGNWSTSPYTGNSQAVVYSPGVVWTMWTRITTSTPSLTARARHRGFGDQRMHVQWREVDYTPVSPFDPECYPGNPFNPDDIVWDDVRWPNITMSAFTEQLVDSAPWNLWIRTLPAPPGGFDEWDAVDVRVGARNLSSTWLFIDEMEIT